MSRGRLHFAFVVVLVVLVPVVPVVASVIAVPVAPFFVSVVVLPCGELVTPPVLSCRSLPPSDVATADGT